MKVLTKVHVTDAIVSDPETRFMNGVKMVTVTVRGHSSMPTPEPGLVTGDSYLRCFLLQDEYVTDITDDVLGPTKQGSLLHQATAADTLRAMKWLLLPLTDS